jgi:methylmalonyl-CoA/ethylmalonyl-CoA epimerase
VEDLAQSRIRQIAVVCQDVARARAFYKDTLRLPHLFDAGPSLSFFDCGGVRLMLSAPEAEVRGTPAIYFLVSGIDETAEALTRRGVTFLRGPHVIARMPDHELWLAEFRDSEGNLLALMEERR